jgi:putative membrane-bound dehydrogenase-like protein
VTRLSAVVLVGLFAATATAQKPGDTPVSADPRLVVGPFAAAPDIVHPIATDFDAKGRLLVVESHTHFRPAKYAGPKYDRIRVLEDTDGDGKADKFTTFFEGTTFTMDLAVHPDGSVYVATRNEILRLRDTNGDGTADEQTRIVFLDTAGNYPHNGLSGLSFDSRGDLTFGMGENLGAPYKLTGSDGIALTGGGEGGNVFHCTADGKKLRRVATGFWNPFGSCRDVFGRLFVVDNDPDSSPPCRLVHVVEGGDYGFQFRYGRSGRHVFQAWNGELPGTLPYVAGTGESPCEVIAYESDGLPAEYRGNLLVPAWADHRVERYVLKPRGASFGADRKPFIQGGRNFYPSGLSVAPDGSLFVTDWGSRSYELHGKGAVWHVRWKDAKPQPRPKEPREALPSADRQTREAGVRELTDSDPFVRHAAVQRLARSPDELVGLDRRTLDDPRARAGVLLAWRASGHKDATSALRKFLNDPDPDVRFLAVKWVSDEKLTAFRPQIVEALKSPHLDPRGFMALTTALARLDDKPVNEDGLAGYFLARLADKAAPLPTRLMAVRSVPATSPKLKTDTLTGLLAEPDPAFRVEVLRALKDRADTKAAPVVRDIARDAKQPSAVRAQAVLTLSSISTPDVTVLKELAGSADAAVAAEAKRAVPDRVVPKGNRPALTDTDAWLKLLDGPADPDAGRRVFENTKLANCSACHRVDGRGATVGPDLSLIGRTDRKWIVESILQPSAVVAPHFQTWKVETLDGRAFTGLLVHTNLDESFYLNEKGDRVKVLATDVAEVTPLRTSIMPDGLLDKLTDQEVRDLVAYLAGRK